MKPVQKMEVDYMSLSAEEYVIQRAKEALRIDPISAKAWMITAKTLYPNNFGLQFEAYQIEKDAGHVKEAAKCFSDLVSKFQQQPEFWMEINKVTSALRSESDTVDNEKSFLCEMFKHISLDVQHKLLLLTANNCADTEEHCKVLLLLLQKFPSSISSHALRLIETLLTAEKHILEASPTNCYRKLLICDLLPLINAKEENVIVLPERLLYTLLDKAVEYHLYKLKEIMNRNNKENMNIKCDETWNNLFHVLEFFGKQLRWDTQLFNLHNSCKKNYWQKLNDFNQFGNHQQLSYSVILFLLYCMYQYSMSMSIEGVKSFVLVEAFSNFNFENQEKVKNPFITTEKPLHNIIISNFLMIVNCWDLIRISEPLTADLNKIASPFVLEPFFSSFLADYFVYKGRFTEAMEHLRTDDGVPFIQRHILRACIFYHQKKYVECFNSIVELLTNIPSNLGTLTTLLTSESPDRHLHYLPLTKINVLQFCCKLLIRCIKNKGLQHELAVGHCFVLMQLDWPQEKQFFPLLIEEILKQRTFYYFLFQTYIIEIDILEQLGYLWSSNEGHIILDIVPNMITRRMGTRGADKGMKEEIKKAIKRQSERSLEPVHDLVYTFLTQEKHHISRTLI